MRFVQYFKDWIWDIFVNGIVSSYFIHFKVRNIIYKILGMNNISTKCAIHSRCYISGKNLEIKRYSYINKNCLLDAKHAYIRIGEKVGIGYNCQLITTNHDYSNSEKRTGKIVAKDITIEDGCWIGAGVTINPGVTIGKGCVVASGSVVAKNCEANCLYAGVPAKLVKKLDN